MAQLTLAAVQVLSLVLMLLEQAALVAVVQVCTSALVIFLA
jgi:hypothetical protein